VKKHVVERFAAAPRRLEEDRELLLNARLAGKTQTRERPEADLLLEILDGSGSTMGRRGGGMTQAPSLRVWLEVSSCTPAQAK
jgi:hypothetical protein